MLRQARTTSLVSRFQYLVAESVVLAEMSTEHSCSLVTQPSGFWLPASMSHHSSGFVARLSNVDDRTPLRYHAAHFSVRTLIVLMLDANVRRSEKGL
jgi:hypothetical protein